MVEYKLSFLSKGKLKAPSSAIIQCLVDSGHRIDPITAVKTVLAAQIINTSGMRKRVVMPAETITSRLLKSELM